jgi:hypothetical protein
MYGSSFIIVTRSPRASRIAPSEAAAMPLPSEDTTPPVTKMRGVIGIPGDSESGILPATGRTALNSGTGGPRPDPRRSIDRLAATRAARGAPAAETPAESPPPASRYVLVQIRVLSAKASTTPPKSCMSSQKRR